MLIYKIIPVNRDEKRQTSSKIEAAVKEGLHKSALPINLSCREKKPVYVHGDKPWHYQDKK